LLNAEIELGIMPEILLFVKSLETEANFSVDNSQKQKKESAHSDVSAVSSPIRGEIVGVNAPG